MHKHLCKVIAMLSTSSPSSPSTWHAGHRGGSLAVASKLSCGSPEASSVTQGLLGPQGSTRACVQEAKGTVSRLHQDRGRRLPLQSLDGKRLRQGSPYSLGPKNSASLPSPAAENGCAPLTLRRQQATLRPERASTAEALADPPAAGRAAWVPGACPRPGRWAPEAASTLAGRAAAPPAPAWEQDEYKACPHGLAACGRDSQRSPYAGRPEVCSQAPRFPRGACSSPPCSS
mmetsp:Transcript_72622/g.183861  ORF Transcript_72622/g.183861 Transcript_72622/m.183861 type:complete len:231 (+) Transcript_72622:86-778(+)